MKGDPVQLIYVSDRKTPLYRCARCADEPVPADLPETPPKLEQVRPIVSASDMTPIGRLVKDLPVDFKSKASGE